MRKMEFYMKGAEGLPDIEVVVTSPEDGFSFIRKRKSLTNRFREMPALPCVLCINDTPHFTAGYFYTIQPEEPQDYADSIMLIDDKGEDHWVVITHEFFSETFVMVRRKQHGH